MGTTPSYGWVFPDPTDLVKDLPADFELFADAVDADLADLLGGANGTILQKASAADHDFAWVLPTGITQLATGTLSGAAINVTSLPTTYKDLLVVVRGFQPTTDNQPLSLRFNADTNTRYRLSSNVDISNATFTDSSLTIFRENDNSVATGLSCINILDYANTTTWKMIEGNSISVNATTTTNFNYTRYVGFYNQTAAITQLNFFAASGNMTAGTYFIYGVN
jgi:hypothetical protein